MPMQASDWLLPSLFREADEYDHQVHSRIKRLDTFPNDFSLTSGFDEYFCLMSA